MKKTNKRAVFLDRDGTINVEVGYLARPEDFVLIDGAAEAIRLLNDAGFAVIVVSNQSGVARGYFTEEDVMKVNDKMLFELNVKGAFVDAVYYCPHHPDFGSGEYGVDCDCRKPKAGMVKKAEEEFGVSIDGSFVVGDHKGDIELGKNIGAKTVLLLSGHGAEEAEKLKAEGIVPDHTCEDLLSAVKYILGS
ncbi:MAG: D-glycero-beta-D-manno-heptose 1,7-bisphosphate 7-phosphatase [Deltaproteobacteria bacterium]|uniref:D,D-heptose 1,7-bisphosphate phosphatase n=1 Tax=Candidatus Zymogenus saltonus TaxID=2844893 RepID=A0A9D8KI07_9DELT|nr:D-glycero-beta-D-manno-heptose 1,7-bisphosphate 7-phosphatase [Candidatus Zymogenus saltonus]